MGAVAGRRSRWTPNDISSASVPGPGGSVSHARRDRLRCRRPDRVDRRLAAARDAVALPMDLEFREILNVQITVVQSAGQPVRVSTCSTSRRRGRWSRRGSSTARRPPRRSTPSSRATEKETPMAFAPFPPGLPERRRAHRGRNEDRLRELAAGDEADERARAVPPAACVRDAALAHAPRGAARAPERYGLRAPGGRADGDECGPAGEQSVLVALPGHGGVRGWPSSFTAAAAAPYASSIPIPASAWSRSTMGRRSPATRRSSAWFTPMRQASSRRRASAATTGGSRRCTRWR